MKAGKETLRKGSCQDGMGEARDAKLVSRRRVAGGFAAAAALVAIEPMKALASPPKRPAGSKAGLSGGTNADTTTAETVTGPWTFTNQTQISRQTGDDGDALRFRFNDGLCLAVTKDGAFEWSPGTGVDVRQYRDDTESLSFAFSADNGSSWWDGARIRRIESGDAGGGQLTIFGKLANQQLRIGQYAYGWSIFCDPGSVPSEQARLLEIYVPKWLSIASSTNDVHPQLGLRNKADGADLSFQLDTDAGYGYIRVGNQEAGTPVLKNLGLAFVVNKSDGSQLTPFVLAASGNAVFSGSVEVGNNSTRSSALTQYGRVDVFRAPAELASSAIRVINASETAARVRILGNGTMEWSDGTNRDTNLYRGGANQLKSDDLVQAVDGVATKAKSGTVSDSDFQSTPPDGTIAVDTAGNRIGVRIGDTWKWVSVA